MNELVLRTVIAENLKSVRMMLEASKQYLAIDDLLFARHEATKALGLMYSFEAYIMLGSVLTKIENAAIIDLGKELVDICDLISKREEELK